MHGMFSLSLGVIDTLDCAVCQGLFALHLGVIGIIDCVLSVLVYLLFPLVS